MFSWFGTNYLASVGVIVKKFLLTTNDCLSGFSGRSSSSSPMQVHMPHTVKMTDYTALIRNKLSVSAQSILPAVP